ncbi:hypothetical protein HW114_09910 [Serratia symbiotica]|uniref:hypothetical protein n=1 Tax=Serratia symbiotica TaxID=138074 RepID=UPI001329D343|nr:hypothetical protein [Serratia symbiotica]MBF1995777.1 hypothetical protein [Serratia symbiotica]QTP13827.1 hypothetical protein GPZ83_0010355 [Serratia symbiotica]
MSNVAVQLTKMLSKDGVRYQLLSSSVIVAKDKLNEGTTEITFGTKAVNFVDAIEAKNTVGIILWISRETYDNFLKGGAK